MMDRALQNVWRGVQIEPSLDLIRLLGLRQNKMLVTFSLLEETTSMASVTDRVVAVTARILQTDAGEIKPEHRFTADLGAESVQSIELVAMFEEEFGIEMDEDAALEVQSVGDAIAFIEQACKEQGVDA